MTGTSLADILTPQQTFEKTVTDKLRADVGGLIPDSVIAEMVTKAINNMFFTKVQTGSGYHQRIEESWFEKEIGTIYKTQIDVQIKKYMEEHKEDVEKMILEFIKEKAPLMIATYFAQVISGSANNMSYDLSNHIKNFLNNH
jgi:hypothetical protein